MRDEDQIPMALSEGSIAETVIWLMERSPKTDEEIARELGYETPVILTMWRNGIVKVPIEKIPALARALNVDAGNLLTRALHDYAPTVLAVLEETFDFMATPNEREWVKVIRHLSGDSDPRMTKEMRQTIQEHFETHGMSQG